MNKAFLSRSVLSVVLNKGTGKWLAYAIIQRIGVSLIVLVLQFFGFDGFQLFDHQTLQLFRVINAMFLC